MSIDGATKDSTTNEPDSIKQATVSSRGSARWVRGRATHWVAFVVLPTMLVGLAGAAGWLAWTDGAQRAAGEASQAAKDSTVAMLSYRADSVDRQLNAAIDLLTGPFKDSYASLIHDVVIPGAKQKAVSASVAVPATASVSASRDQAVVLVFVNQTTTIAASPPTTTQSAVRVSLEKVDQRWLVSGFEPI